MIRTVLSIAAIMLMVATIVFGVIQLNITVVRADGCPSGPAQAQMSNCGGCNLVSATSSWVRTMAKLPNPLAMRIQLLGLSRPRW
jgi:hypothetical protein